MNIEIGKISLALELSNIWCRSSRTKPRARWTGTAGVNNGQAEDVGGAVLGAGPGRMSPKPEGGTAILDAFTCTDLACQEYLVARGVDGVRAGLPAHRQ